MSSSSFLGLTRENALQGDREVEHQERLHVYVCLAAPDRGDARRIHGGQIGGGRLIHLRRRVPGKIAGSDDQRSRRGRAVEHVRMRRNLGDRERVPLLAASLAEGMAATHVNGHITLQVRKAEIDPAVPTVRGAQEREKRLILVDGKKLPIAGSPTFGRESEAHDADLTEEWFCHFYLLASSLSIGLDDTCAFP